MVINFKLRNKYAINSNCNSKNVLSVLVCRISDFVEATRSTFQEYLEELGLGAGPFMFSYHEAASLMDTSAFHSPVSSQGHLHTDLATVNTPLTDTEEWRWKTQTCDSCVNAEDLYANHRHNCLYVCVCVCRHMNQSAATAVRRWSSFRQRWSSCKPRWSSSRWTHTCTHSVDG